MLRRHGLAADAVVGTPYLFGIGPFLWRPLRGRTPYLRGELAVQLGFDVVVSGARV